LVEDVGVVDDRREVLDIVFRGKIMKLLQKYSKREKRKKKQRKEANDCRRAP
jgi:hypothetical protein